VSWADGPVNDMNEQSATPPDFGIYVYDLASGQNQLVYNDRSTWEVNALAVVPRAEPPAVATTQRVQDVTQPAHLGSVDVKQTSLTGDLISGAQFNSTPLDQALKEAVAVRVIEGFSSEGAKGVTMFGLTMFEGAAVLGEAPVFADGSWLADVPPYIPIHLQPIDKFGLSIRSQQLWIHGVPNESRRCIGCHESRTGQGVPALQTGQTVAEHVGAQPYANIPIAMRAEYPWDKKVQPILDAKCVGCHNSQTTSYYTVTRTDPVTGQVATYNVPTLDLSSAPVTVYYDRRVATWPASYVSIFYPAALEMGKVTVTGTVPPKYGIPGDARNSVLPQKLNLRAPDGTTAWPLSSNPLHPEDKMVTLTDDERKTLAVYPMDLGGQFYARQNTGFTPYMGGDPVNPTQAPQ
jgi:hypothetical protein